MPVVHVHMWEGKTVEQKAKLIKKLAQAFNEIGVRSSSVTIIIHDISKTNWGLGEEQAS